MSILNIWKMVQELETFAAFNELLEKCKDKRNVVHFTATWCGPCQRFAPIIESLSHEYTDAVFVKIDVDTNSETSEHLNISRICANSPLV